MKRNLLDKTRLTLTLQFTLVVMVISLAMTLTFFYRTQGIFRGEFERINLRFQREEFELTPPPGGPGMMRHRIKPEDLVAARQNLIRQLAGINLLVLVVTGVSGYGLAGLALKPIGAAMARQKRFISDAAHELKTPITALKTTLEVNLMETNLEAKTKQVLKENLEDVNKLAKLSESLLKLAVGEEVTLKLEAVRLSAIIQGVVKQVRPLYREKKITLQVDKLPESAKIKGEINSLIDLSVILLDNAAKYSRAKQIVSVQLLAHSKHWGIVVADQGRGMTPEQREHIFERFYQANSARTKNGSNGVGLGLAIADQIARQHQGWIEVESQPGKGSTFTVWLPKA